MEYIIFIIKYFNSKLGLNDFEFSKNNIDNIIKILRNEILYLECYKKMKILNLIKVLLFSDLILLIID